MRLDWMPNNTCTLGWLNWLVLMTGAERTALCRALDQAGVRHHTAITWATGSEAAKWTYEFAGRVYLGFPWADEDRVRAILSERFGVAVEGVKADRPTWLGGPRRPLAPGDRAAGEERMRRWAA